MRGTLGRLAAATLVVAAVGRAEFAAAVDCPLNPSSDSSANASLAHCELFCNGSCPYHPDWSTMAPENLTVYRITPANVTGLSQKDTGDAGGDAGFYAGMMLVHLAECKPPYTSWGCFLAEKPVITKYLLETDGVYGPYLKCTPCSLKASEHLGWAIAPAVPSIPPYGLRHSRLSARFTALSLPRGLMVGSPAGSPPSAPSLTVTDPALDVLTTGNPRVHTDSDGHVLWEDTATFDCTYGNNVPYMGRIGGCACERANKSEQPATPARLHGIIYTEILVARALLMPRSRLALSSLFWFCRSGGDGSGDAQHELHETRCQRQHSPRLPGRRLVVQHDGGGRVQGQCSAGRRQRELHVAHRRSGQDNQRHLPARPHRGFHRTEQPGATLPLPCASTAFPLPFLEFSLSFHCLSMDFSLSFHCL